MTAPQQPKLHTVQPPPQSDPLVAAVATVLAAGVAISATGGLVTALGTLLHPYGVREEAIAAALRLSARGTANRPRPHGTGDLARAAAEQERYFRAAYLIRAAWRIQQDLNAGLSLRTAIARESRFQRAHEQARLARQEAIRRTMQAAKLFGPVLGWYLDRSLHNEAECIAADGHNFEAAVGTAIGWPGMVHAGCGCTAGPPIMGAGWVDDAVRPHIRFGRPRRMIPLRRAG